MNLLKQIKTISTQPKSWKEGEYELLREKGDILLKKYTDELELGMNFKQFQSIAKKHKQIVKLIDRGWNYKQKGTNYRYEISVDVSSPRKTRQIL